MRYFRAVFVISLIAWTSLARAATQKVCQQNEFFNLYQGKCLHIPASEFAPLPLETQFLYVYHSMWLGFNFANTSNSDGVKKIKASLGREEVSNNYKLYLKVLNELPKHEFWHRFLYNVQQLKSSNTEAKVIRLTYVFSANPGGFLDCSGLHLPSVFIDVRDSNGIEIASFGDIGPDPCNFKVPDDLNSRLYGNYSEINSFYKDPIPFFNQAEKNFRTRQKAEPLACVWCQ